MRNVIQHVFELGVALGFGFVMAHCGTGCKPAGYASQEEINAAYVAELTACVETAKTKEEADSCRRAVNYKYGLCTQVQWPNISPCD